MNHYELLLFAIGTAVFFRVGPFLLGNDGHALDRSSKVYRFLSYSAQAMLGVMCFESTFGKRDFLQIVASAQPIDLYKLVILIAVFSYAAKTQKLILPFVLSTSLYFGLLLYS